MIHFHQMRDLVHCEIFKHERRRQNQPPGIRQHAGARTRTPAACLIAHRNALDRDIKLLGGTAARGFQLALGLALEIIADPPADMRRLTRHA